MQQISINLWAVLVSGFSTMVWGFLWYGPLFGKTWMKLVGMSMEDMQAGKSKMGRSYLLAFLGSLLTAYVLAHFLGYAGAETAGQGAQGAFWAWLGFVVPMNLSGVLWTNKPWKLYFLEVGYYLASLVTMGLILGGWK